MAFLSNFTAPKKKPTSFLASYGPQTPPDFSAITVKPAPQGTYQREISNTPSGAETIYYPPAMKPNASLQQPFSTQPAIVQPSQPFSINKIADNSAGAKALIDKVGSTLDRTSGAIISPMAGTPLENVNGKMLPMKFSDQVNRGATAAFGQKYGPAIGLAVGMIGDPLNLVGPGEVKGATTIAKFKPNELKFLQEATAHILSGNTLKEQGWNDFRKILTSKGLEVPSTQKKAADFMDAVFITHEEQAFNAATDASLAKSSPATGADLASRNRTPPGQPRQPNGWWSSFKKIFNDQRGFVKNPAAPDEPIPNGLVNNAENATSPEWNGIQSSKPSTADATPISNAPSEKGGTSGLKTSTSDPFGGDTLYHGTDKFSADKIKQEGFRKQSDVSSSPNGQYLGKGLYMTNHRPYAEYFATKNKNTPYQGDVIEANLPKDAKILHVENPNAFHDNPEFRDANGRFDPQLVTDKYSKLGYDGIKADGIDKGSYEIVIFDPPKLKISSPSIPKGLEGLAAEARKYGSAEEFAKAIETRIGNGDAAANDMRIALQKEYPAPKFTSFREMDALKSYRDFFNKVKGGTQISDRPFPRKTGERGFIKLGGDTPPENTGRSITPQEPAALPASSPTPRQIPSLLDDTSAIATSPALNTDHLNISGAGKDLIKQTIEDIRPQIDQRIGSQLSNKKVLDLADNTSKILTSTVGKEQTANFAAAMLKAREELARAAEMGTVDQHFIDTLLAVKTHGTDIGRKLQALSIGADPKETSAAQAIVSGVLDQTDDIDAVIKAAEGVDFNDSQQAAKFYRQFVKPKTSEWLDLLRYNSMLSSPKTHIVNAVSNAINSAIVAPIEKAVTGGLDFLASTVTGAPRKHFAGESAAYIEGYLNNTKEAFHKFGEVMRGSSASTNLDLRNVPLAPQGGVKGALEKGLNFPMRMLEGMDQFFTALTEGAETSALNYKAGKGTNVTATAAKLEPAKGAAYRLYRQDLFPEGQGMLLNAVDELTSLLFKARSSKNPLISYPAKFSIPFIKTPMNIFKQGLEYSPTGFFTAVGAAEKSPQIAKALIGSSVFAAGGALLAANRLSWATPTNETEKNAFLAAGMQPYSVKVGNNWVSYQKLPPPLAFPLSMIAMINQAQKEKKLSESNGELILSAISKYGQFLADQSYAKSFGDLIAAISGGESSIAKLASNYPTQLIPYRAFSGWLARLTDHIQRKPDPSGTFVEKEVQYLMMNIPGLSEKVPAREDASGHTIPEQAPVLNALSPFQVSTENPDKVQQYEDVTDLRRRISKQTDERTLVSDAADSWYARLSALPKAEAATQFDTLSKENPALAQKVVDLFTEDQKGITPQEKLIAALNVTNGERAKYIADKINSTKSKDDKAQLWEEYVGKKLITKQVATQLQELIQ